jgi:hypothetical protein
VVCRAHILGPTTLHPEIKQKATPDPTTNYTVVYSVKFLTECNKFHQNPPSIDGAVSFSKSSLPFFESRGEFL